MFVLSETINLEENPSVNGTFTSQSMYAVFPPMASDKHTVIFLTGFRSVSADNPLLCCMSLSMQRCRLLVVL
jgi:hypothetical protein